MSSRAEGLLRVSGWWLIPTARSLPSCSGPSRSGLEMQCAWKDLRDGPSLTGPARDGLKRQRVGMEGWAPQGAEQKDRISVRSSHYRYPTPVERMGSGRSQETNTRKSHAKFSCARPVRVYNPRPSI